LEPPGAALPARISGGAVRRGPGTQQSRDLSVHFDQGLDERARQIGEQIFELSAKAAPRVWKKAWWLEQMTRLVDRDESLRARAFQFVECLPALGSNEAISLHLNEFFHDVDALPRAARAWLRPGPAGKWREQVTGWFTKYGAKMMAGRFITGFDIPSAIQTIERLRSQGMAFTFDVLGESTTSNAQADRYAAVYHQILHQLPPIAARWPNIPFIDMDERGPMPRVNVSVKLTGLDPYFDPIDPERSYSQVCSRLRPLLLHARKVGAFVNVDMESSKHRELTINVFQQLLMEDGLRDWEHVGIVLQAYLKAGERDLENMLHWARCRGTRFAVRLVKGAYWDAETAAAERYYADPPVWTNKWETDACYERMARTMLESAGLIRPCFASHNVRSLAVVSATAERLALSPKAYELQMLYGMGDPLKSAVVGMGQCLRVYCPYGDLMPGMAYLIRRLLENSSNDGFLKQSFGDPASHRRLLANPAIAKPASTPPPRRYYTDLDSEKPMSPFKNAPNTSFANPANRQKMLGAINYVRGELGRAYPLVINGDPVDTDGNFTSHNPSRRDEAVGIVADAGLADTDRAVAAARKAFATWRTTSAAERAALLRKAADRLEDRRFELAATMILEIGKPWREADAEVSEAIDHCRYYAEQMEQIDRHPRLRNIPGESNRLVYSPKGVCAVISPYAFPLSILTGMTTAALAAGNTVVVKPASQASVIASKFVNILHEAGLYPGAANLLLGRGDRLGPPVVEHSDVNLVAFTGSAQVGTSVIHSGAMVRPGQPYIKKMIVEMGGKNAIIVDDDADLDGAVQAIVDSAFAFAGQKCSSCSRVIVLGGVYDAFCSRLRDAVMSIPIGPAEEPMTMTGPLIDECAVERVQRYIELARKEGKILVQAQLPNECEHGYFVPPTVVTGISPRSSVSQEEIFGPVLVVHAASDFDSALAMANDTRYALTGGLFSRSPAHIEQACRQFDVGNLYINRRITGSQVDAQPFGGFKLSGTGVKAGSQDYLLHFMDARCITENTQRSGFVPHEERSATKA
jgi:RHH-type transcriptional regulator, proline utilization regulon repressor / proline dehydrogenase / delta 1-pyrroline-5-carboxylate dehydrogenase